MTTHRNLKPHYAEPKGKSGPVIRIPAPHDPNCPTPDDSTAWPDDDPGMYGEEMDGFNMTERNPDGSVATS